MWHDRPHPAGGTIKEWRECSDNYRKDTEAVPPADAASI